MENFKAIDFIPLSFSVRNLLLPKYKFSVTHRYGNDICIPKSPT